MRGREAALEQGAALGKRDLVLDVEVGRGELGMRDDDVTDAHLARRVDDREDLVAGEMSGRQDETVAGDHSEHGEELRQQVSCGVEHGDRRRLETLVAKLGLDAHPQRRRRAFGVDAVACARLADGVHGRQPDDPRPLPRGDLDRERVEAADRRVQRQRPDDVHARHRPRDDLRALRGRRVVRLEPESG